ncbi:transcription repressor NadR [Fervidobacterium sp. 2310opik-2]|uniref:transcription repressor NadR n=1 Tax=Fervidobacterium sp. 2310opik-2 TaxID=1755815 RepID=UPI0013DF26DC|nr:transcription repressor NadR [Fervidobacterium sp. 2310opik-2]KAF2962542.1 transcriptional regulator [Fervidobacterium sp. 2310opik-2]
MERRYEIIEILKKSKSPVKGKDLSDLLGVSRQIIVYDIARLREEGYKIVSTRDGYVLDTGGKVRRTIAFKHTADDIYDELKAIVENGGKVIDVIVEHPIYGEITGRIDVSSIDDVEKFISLLKASNTKPLLEISGGIHLHTIEAPDEETMERILKAVEKYRLI